MQRQPYHFYAPNHQHEDIPNPLNFQAGERLIRSHVDVESYRDRPEPFSNNPVGAVAYARTYSRKMKSGQQERWHDTVLRCMSGWAATLLLKLGCDDIELINEMGRSSAIADMYDGLFDLRWMPSGRGLWAAGTKMQQRSGASLYNCKFVSTMSPVAREAVVYGDAEPGVELVKALGQIMDLLMFGCGVGADLEGRRVKVYRPVGEAQAVVVDDSREGWVYAMQEVWASYLIPGRAPVDLDTSGVRWYGASLDTTGGVSSGPGPLLELAKSAAAILNAVAQMGNGTEIGIEPLADLINMIGRAVAMGNIRRSAEIIIFGYTPSKDVNARFLALKELDASGQMRRGDWGWASNNSFEYNECPPLKMSSLPDGEEIMDSILRTGETGFRFGTNVGRYSWMGVEDRADMYAIGNNPCAEINLEHLEGCNIPKVILPRNQPHQIDTSVLSAYLWGKVVSLLDMHIPEMQAVTHRNRRLGICASGVMDFLFVHGHDYDLSKHTRWLKDFDRETSKVLGVNPSIRLFAVAPDGTTGKVAGVSSGVHSEWSEYMIQRIRVGENSNLWRQAEAAGYPVEDLLVSGKPVSHTKVITFPVHNPSARVSARNRSMFAQLAVAAKMAREWADNAVSVTITIPPHEANRQALERAIAIASCELKTVSFLPFYEPGQGYDQMPWEEITEDQYRTLVSKITPPTVWLSEHDMSDTGCDGVACQIKSLA